MDSLNELTKEELIAKVRELERIIGDEKYGLVFDRKSSPEDVVEKCKQNIPILIHEKECDVLNGGQENILIEGDNFACLTALNLIKNDKGFVDIICIDPPYNTGNGDFTFRDGFKNTDWLCMMERRLTLAKNLLKDTGIIYVNIDDNEDAELKLLCDSIFGSNNYLSDFVWLNNMKGRQISTGGAVKTYEHILLYAKNASKIPTFEGDIRELSKEMPLIYKDTKYEVMIDQKGKFIVKNELYNTNSAFNEETRPNLVFNIYYNPQTKEIITCDIDKCLENDSGFVLIEPHKNSDGVHQYHAWRWSKEKIEREKDELYFEEDKGEWRVYTKKRDIYSTNIKDVMSNSTNGNNELKKILGEKKFDYPKPVKLIKRLLKHYEKILIVDEDGENLIDIPEPIVVLDFFAGSGTTAQAVLELNNEDGKNRIFILNTLNEVSEKTTKQYLISKGLIRKNATKTILNKYIKSDDFKTISRSEEYQNLGVCRAVAYPRIKTVITGIRPDGSKYSDGLPGSVRYFKTGFVSDNEYREQAKYDLVEQCDGLLCILETAFDKCGEGRFYNIYSNMDKTKGMAIFSEDYSEKYFKDMLEDLKKSNFKENVIYYFKQDDEHDSYIEGIVSKEIPDAVAKPIPSKIYEIYKRIADELRRNY